MGLVPDVGRNVMADILIGDSTTTIDKMGVGTGSTSPSASDTSLDNQVYRASSSDSSVTIARTQNTGEFEATITVNGGTEVAAGTDITEFGVFTANDVLVYRDTISALTVQAGETVSQTADVDVLNN